MSQSLAEQVCVAIKQGILSLEMLPGSVIAQPVLADRYQSSITLIREALQMLAREGLIQSIPRFGCVAAPITVTDVQELFQVGLVLEKAAARLAASRAAKTKPPRNALSRNKSAVRNSVYWKAFFPMWA